MPGALLNTFRLARAGFVLAQHGVRFVPKGVPVPLPLRIARAATVPIRLIAAPFRADEPPATRVATALTELGPSYVKLGQFLATRADIIGPELSADLRHLQDKADPFSMAEARDAVERALGGKLEDHFVEFGPPVAAASIAQVHKAYVMVDGVKKPVAVKILRPNIEKRFRRDLDSYYFAARMIERYYAGAALEAGGGRRQPEAHDRTRDGFAARGGGDLRDGRQHQRRRRLSRSRRRLEADREARPDRRMDRRHADIASTR